MMQSAFKHIVVGVDFSDYSKILVKQARLLCELWGTKLVLVYAIHDQVEYMSTMYAGFPNLLSEKDYQKRLRKTYEVKDISTQIVARHGLPSVLIQETALRFPDSMMMIGHKGQSKIESFIFGSTAQALAANAKTPLWIHRGSKVVRPQKVLIPHDLSLESNRSIDVIEKLSLAMPVSYEVFYVKKKPFPILNFKTDIQKGRQIIEKTKERVDNFLKDYPQVPFVTASGKVTSKIAKRSEKFDLLLMTHHNTTGIFSKSETENLLDKVKTPLLILC